MDPWLTPLEATFWLAFAFSPAWLALAIELHKDFLPYIHRLTKEVS